VEQFFKLPPAQRAAVLAALVAVIGLGLYFAMVDPQITRAEANKRKLQQIQAEVTTLQAEASPEIREALRKKKDQLVEKDRENRKMLPSADEIPNFIESVQRDATGVGLTVKRFDRLNEESEDLYNSIPIRMTVEGSMLDFIEFLRIYATNERRVINIRDLQIEQIPPDYPGIQKQLDAAQAPAIVDGKEQQGRSKADFTPEEKLLNLLLVRDEARKASQMRATFVAYAFVWTGKPAEPKPGQAPKAKPKRKRT
jgi:Tfp pilus assembly protein PilO